MNKEFILSGLNCAHCASEIERDINGIENVEAAVNFATKILKVKINNNENTDKTFNKIFSIIHKYEPEIAIKERSYKQENSEYSQMKEIVRFIIGAVLFASGLILKLPNIYTLIIFLLSYLIAGGHVILKAFKNILKGKVFDENFLMSIATIGAFAVGQAAEGAAVMLFYQAGEILQSRAVNRSRKSIAALMDIRPDYANIDADGEVKKVPVEDVKEGQIIIIKPGEKVPLDGIVINGASTADTSALTGESLPKDINKGDEILSGYININGLITVKVTKEFSESTVSKIIDLVENAASKKAQTENFITKFAKVYTPIVVLGAVLVALIPPLFIDGALGSVWIYRALIFLVISCPCALVISIPLGFFGGIGAASKNGILIKGSNYLEALCNAGTVVFDKTGTLTKGVFKVTSVEEENGYTKQEVLTYAAYAESFSNHPIASSILKAYGKEIDKQQVQSYEEITGKGIAAVIAGRRVLAGNSKLLDDENIIYKKNANEGTVVYVAVDSKFAGAIVISDEIKEDAFSLISELKNIGIKKTVMLTGDNKSAADKVGSILGIDEVYPELLPAQKVEILQELISCKNEREKIIFAGDGINDAPALALADISIAMGGLGSDAAIEAADVVIMTDEPSKIMQAIKISKRTKAIIWQNIIFALGVKGIFLLLGAFGIASMWEAVFADVGVTLIAVINSMRALKIRD
ncbi:MAG: cadmium-translocating P-type ATPase [Eubacteriaceae bacterium]|nr:cadmium-translocating P-type ATPase [Eubacteriaceae bacterium]